MVVEALTSLVVEAWVLLDEVHEAQMSQVSAELPLQLRLPLPLPPCLQHRNRGPPPQLGLGSWVPLVPALQISLQYWKLLKPAWDTMLTPLLLSAPLLKLLQD